MIIPSDLESHSDFPVAFLAAYRWMNGAPFAARGHGALSLQNGAEAPRRVHGNISLYAGHAENSYGTRQRAGTAVDSRNSTIGLSFFASFRFAAQYAFMR